MHEMSLVRSVVDIVLEHAKKTQAREVRAVHLVIGEGRDVVQDYMDGLFKFLARDTVAARADLVIRTTPLTVRCNRCGHVFPIDFARPETWVCPECAAPRDYKLNSGMEFVIDSIECR